jgi:hypothetical protein
VEGVAALAARRNRQALRAFQEESPHGAESVMRMTGFAELKNGHAREVGPARALRWRSDAGSAG